MQIWIEEKAWSPESTVEMEAQLGHLDYVRPILDFLHFWNSDEPGFNVRTSGSTSDPKTFSVRRNRIIASAKATVDYFRLKPGSDGLLLCLSARHVGGFMILARGLLADSDVWVVPPSSNPLPEGGWPLFRNWLISLVPAQFYSLLKVKNIEDQSSRWKGILLGGAPLDSGMLTLLPRISCPVFHSYGMTETVSHIALRQIHPREGPTEDLDALPFDALQGIQVRTNPDQCLEVCGPVTGGEWLSTRDLGRIISEGKFLFLGRADRIINSAGIKLDPEEIRRWLKTLLPDVHPDFEVLGISDPFWGEKPVLVFFGTGNEDFSSFWNRLNWEEIQKQVLGTELRRQFPKSVFYLPSRFMTESMKTDFPRIKLELSRTVPVWERHGKSRP